MRRKVTLCPISKSVTKMPARMAAANRADQIAKGVPNWSPIRIRAPKPLMAPVGSSPTMVPTNAAAIPTLSPVNR